jgi:hypothetical protein
MVQPDIVEDLRKLREEYDLLAKDYDELKKEKLKYDDSLNEEKSKQEQMNDKI